MLQTGLKINLKMRLLVIAILSLGLSWLGVLENTAGYLGGSTLETPNNPSTNK